ncbi:hypothetical protein [Flavobacterium sp.]|uniref:hypothetical protein n=1 Tax=Flavobacterium sp. TaxID=239 RepID=UPI0038D0AE8F
MPTINKYLFLFVGGCLLMLNSCSTKDDYVSVPVSPVVVDLTQVPYPKLSDYKFFEGELKNMSPAYGVLPYKPTSELFTDYAEKKRFVWIPNGLKASYQGDAKILDLPVGSAVIKMFYYNHVVPNNTTRIVETRLMIRKETGWIFAEYVWNSEQTEAYLQNQGSQTAISWTDESNNLRSINYKIPSTVTDCKRCHGLNNGSRFPLGIKPQNLNSNFNFSEGSKNQLNKWIEYGYLENNLPSQIVSVVDYKDTSKSLDLRVRSYFDANCSHCHVDGGEADVFDLRFGFDKTTDPANMGVGVPAQHYLAGYNGRIVQPGNVGQSILFYRVQTETDNFYMMPALGRTIKHDMGVQLIQDWINSL